MGLNYSKDKIVRLKKEVFEQNLKLVSGNLVILTWGNVSGIDRETGLVAIKPSGVEYGKLTVDDIVVLDLDGKVVEGKLKPSSDTPTHLYLYKHFKEIGGIVHTHSVNATAYAQSGLNIIPYGTTHADAFYGEVPCSRALTKAEVDENYELNTGKVIVETFKKYDYKSVPAVIVRNHGPFSWGDTPQKAVENSITLEAVAEMAIKSKIINQNVQPIDDYLLDKHYFRKHGNKCYYGQNGKI